MCYFDFPADVSRTGIPNIDKLPGDTAVLAGCLRPAVSSGDLFSYQMYVRETAIFIIPYQQCKPCFIFIAYIRIVTAGPVNQPINIYFAKQAAHSFNRRIQGYYYFCHGVCK